MPNLTFISSMSAVDEELSDSKKTPKPSVNYTNPSKFPWEQCQHCRNFIAPNRCKTVYSSPASPIELTAWCVRFKPFFSIWDLRF